MILENLDETNKAIIRRFLHKSPLGVLGTVSPDGTPQTALIAFAEYDNLDIIFETFQGTRKAQNLAYSTHASLTTGFSTVRHQTIQIDGTVVKLPRTEYARCIEHFSKKDTPCGPEFLNDPRVEFYRLTPTWLRYSDYNIEPNIFEIDLTKLDH